MAKTFIYWDHSNIFIGVQDAAGNREGRDARYRVRLDFDNLYQLAQADRPVASALAVGSIPPPLRHVWNRLEGQGIEVELMELGKISHSEYGVDEKLQVRMLRDALDNNGDPGIVVLLTGDGKGFYDGVGFHADIERMHKKGWRIEVLSWNDSCNRKMRDWVEKNGLFISLDDFYENITFLEPPRPGQGASEPRYAVALDISKRKTL